MLRSQWPVIAGGNESSLNVYDSYGEHLRGNSVIFRTIRILTLFCRVLGFFSIERDAAFDGEFGFLKEARVNVGR